MKKLAPLALIALSALFVSSPANAVVAMSFWGLGIGGGLGAVVALGPFSAEAGHHGRRLAQEADHLLGLVSARRGGGSEAHPAILQTIWGTVGVTRRTLPAVVRDAAHTSTPRGGSPRGTTAG